MGRLKIFVIEKLLMLFGLICCLSVPYVIYGGLFGFLEPRQFVVCVIAFICIFFLDKVRRLLTKLVVTPNEIVDWRVKEQKNVK